MHYNDIDQKRWGSERAKYRSKQVKNVIKFISAASSKKRALSTRSSGDAYDDYTANRGNNEWVYGDDDNDDDDEDDGGSSIVGSVSIVNIVIDDNNDDNDNNIMNRKISELSSITTTTTDENNDDNNDNGSGDYNDDNEDNHFIMKHETNNESIAHVTPTAPTTFTGDDDNDITNVISIQGDLSPV